MNESLESLQERLCYRFVDVHRLEEALTHGSYQNEHPQCHSYERMEFLGDSVLGFIVAEMLFSRYPDLEEGALTACKSQIVGGVHLADVGERLCLADHVILGQGERKDGHVRPSILADLVESVLAAVFLDGGIQAARELVEKLFGEDVESMKNGLPSDAKSHLQARVLSETGKLPRYRLVSESGPDHEKVFVFEVKSPAGLSAMGEGGSKKTAQQAAAEALLALLEG